MAGRGRVPKGATERHNPRSKPTRGEWQPPTSEVGWQHGEVPEPPDGLLKASREAWAMWMTSWIGSHWSPVDLPGLRQVIRLYDQVERGDFVRSAELRLEMDTYGITPKGQQDRRWRPPEADSTSAQGRKVPTDGHYGHLRAVKAAK